MNKNLALLKLIRASQPMFLFDGRVSSSLGGATYITIIASTLSPSLKAIIGSRSMAPTDSTFDFRFGSQPSYWDAVSIVLFQDPEMPSKCGIQWPDLLRYAEVEA